MLLFLQFQRDFMPPLVRNVLEHSLHVFYEKPFCLSIEDGEELLIKWALGCAEELRNMRKSFRHENFSRLPCLF